jgi:hypothetical protein
MDQLVEQSGVKGLTSLDLFHQWWDTQNPHPGLGLGPHCTDQVDGSGNPILNGFPYACRPGPAEGGQITSNPFEDPDTNADAYIPIGLFNRFDLAPSAGTHCGEYRIVYAKRSGITEGKCGRINSCSLKVVGTVWSLREFKPIRTCKGGV